MSRTLITDIVLLTRDGWRPYGVEPQGAVYERLHCPQYDGATHKMRKKGMWFVKGDQFLCMGCRIRCSLLRPEGFSLPLPIQYPQPDKAYTLTPLEMVTRKSVLRVDEAAYCLNVSERMIYTWIACGKLAVLKDMPRRVKSADVKQMMEDFDE